MSVTMTVTINLILCRAVSLKQSIDNDDGHFGYDTDRATNIMMTMRVTVTMNIILDSVLYYFSEIVH